MRHMKKLCEIPNFGLIQIVRHKVTSFVSQKYDTEDDILVWCLVYYTYLLILIYYMYLLILKRPLVCTYCKITQEISISLVYFKQKMGLFKKSL